jgi:antitoxin component YwqK of YwqJK toxin-antitoxin module
VGDLSVSSNKETIYYDNGNVKHSGSFKNGVMHGPWKFYRRDGSIMRAGKMNQGKPIGIWTTYDRGGSVVKETNFGE